MPDAPGVAKLLKLRTCPKITSGFRLRFAVDVETGR
jgi:hypothetical protein